VKVEEFRRRTAKSIQLRSVDREQKEQTLPARDVLWPRHLGEPVIGGGFRSAVDST
jgi:hypothetical protein